MLLKYCKILSLNTTYYSGMAQDLDDFSENYMLQTEAKESLQ